MFKHASQQAPPVVDTVGIPPSTTDGIIRAIKRNDVEALESQLRSLCIAGPSSSSPSPTFTGPSVPATTAVAPSPQVISGSRGCTCSTATSILADFDDDGYSPMYYALARRSLDAFRCIVRFIDEGSSSSATDGKAGANTTPSYPATISSSPPPSLSHQLLGPTAVYYRFDPKTTPLHWAARFAAHSDVYDAMLRTPAGSSSRNNTASCGLHSGATLYQASPLSSSSLLLALRDEYGRTPLQRLLEDHSDGRSPHLYSVGGGSNKTSTAAPSAATTTSSSGSNTIVGQEDAVLEGVTALIAAGADVNTARLTSNTATTSIAIAAAHSYSFSSLSSSARMLSSSTSPSTSQPPPAFHIAIRCGFHRVVEAFIVAGGEGFMSGEAGRMALSVAMRAAGLASAGGGVGSSHTLNQQQNNHHHHHHHHHHLHRHPSSCCTMYPTVHEAIFALLLRSGAEPTITRNATTCTATSEQRSRTAVGRDAGGNKDSNGEENDAGGGDCDDGEDHTYYRCPLLFEAVRCGCLWALRQLLAYGCPIEVVEEGDGEGGWAEERPAGGSFVEGHEPAVVGSVGTATTTTSKAVSGSGGRSLLHVAVAHTGGLFVEAVLQCLLDCGADVSAAPTTRRNNNRNNITMSATPLLHYAAQCNCAKSAALLVSEGAVLGTRDGLGMTALDYAGRSSRLYLYDGEVAQLLLRAGGGGGDRATATDEDDGCYVPSSAPKNAAEGDELIKPSVGGLNSASRVYHC